MESSTCYFKCWWFRWPRWLTGFRGFLKALSARTWIWQDICGNRTCTKNPIWGSQYVKTSTFQPRMKLLASHSGQHTGTELLHYLQWIETRDDKYQWPSVQNLTDSTLLGCCRQLSTQFSHTVGTVSTVLLPFSHLPGSSALPPVLGALCSYFWVACVFFSVYNRNWSGIHRCSKLRLVTEILKVKL